MLQCGFHLWHLPPRQQKADFRCFPDEVVSDRFESGTLTRIYLRSCDILWFPSTCYPADRWVGQVGRAGGSDRWVGQLLRVVVQVMVFR